ncbi:MAG: aminotransferase class I/II-fold pyridoxal phosphate-dependent enzyme [candidate division Zixibacteria bacterium]
MTHGAVSADQSIDSLVSSIARSAALRPDMILPFVDLSDFMTELFTVSDRNHSIMVAGHCSPDIAIAADRAEMKVTEQIGISPFSSDPKNLINSLESDDSIIYLANPNRVSGASLGLSDLELLASAVKNGLLIIDEYFCDFYTITGQPLLEQFDNVILVRSFASAFGVASAVSGFAIGQSSTINRLRKTLALRPLSRTLHRVLATTLENSDAKSLRVKLIHDEALRIADELTPKGVLCRMSSTDFLLIRVADPARVGNSLNAAKVSVDNLDGYPGLKGYLRYRVCSELANDALIDAFKRMSPDLYQMQTADRRSHKLRAGAEGGSISTDSSDNRTPKRAAKPTKKSRL